MNRRRTAWALVAIAALGLTGCTAPAPGPTASASPTPDAAASASLARACLAPTETLAEASTQMAEASAAIAASGAVDPQATIDAFDAAIANIGAAATAATNPEIKTVLGTVHDEYGAFGAVLTRVLIDHDYAAVQELPAIADDIQDAVDAFKELCTP